MYAHVHVSYLHSELFENHIFTTFQGCTVLKHLGKKEENQSAVYSHHDSIDDFLSALRDVVQTDLLSDVAGAPFKMYSLQADEATDCANLSSLIIYIRYMGPSGAVK